MTAATLATTVGTDANRSESVLRYSALLRSRNGDRPGLGVVQVERTWSGVLPPKMPQPLPPPAPVPVEPPVGPEPVDPLGASSLTPVRVAEDSAMSTAPT